MSNIDRRYAYYDEGVLPEEGEYGVTYLTLYSSDSGNVYDGWMYDPENKIAESLTPRTFGYRNPDYPNYCWDDEVVVDLSNAQARQESSEFAQGRITSFNTNVSSRPIVLQDIDITGLTESEREAKATTVLFSAIPLVKDAYIQAEVEVQCKVNLSPDNTTGIVRVEAFYILNDESDRTMRPNPVHTFSVSSNNERHTLPWLYWNPALNHEDHNYIGVKLIATGGTVEIGISDDPNYGDAMITLTSAGLTGDTIFEGKPVNLEIMGLQEVVPHYKLKIDDYTVLCTYDTGEVYDVTHFCEFFPEMGEEITEAVTTLHAYYMGLDASMNIYLGMVDSIELIGLAYFHDEYTFDIKDYTVMAHLDNDTVWEVTEDCTFDPPMGTTINQNTTLTATYEPSWMPSSEFTDSLDIESVAVSRTYGNPNYDDIIYTLYEDGYCTITGQVSDSWEVSDEEILYLDTDKAYDQRDAYMGLYSATINGSSRRGRQFSNVTITPGRTVGQLDKYCCVQIPEYWAISCKVVEYKLKGKPLTFNNVDGQNQCNFPHDCKFIGFDKMDTSKIVSLHAAFRTQDSERIDTSHNCILMRTSDSISFLNDLEFPSLKDLNFAFEQCDLSTLTGLRSADSIITMMYAFRNANSDNTNFLKQLNTSNVVNMVGAFYRSNNSNYIYDNWLIDNVDFIWNWDLDNVQRSDYMFYQWYNLKTIHPFSSKRMRNLFSCSYMFYDCRKLVSIHSALGRLENKKLKYADSMFELCRALQQIDGNLGFFLNLVDGSTIKSMFKNCDVKSLLGMQGAIGRNISNIDYLFYGNKNLTSIRGCESWDVSNITITWLFYDTAIDQSQLQYLAGWNISSTKNCSYLVYNTYVSASQAYEFFSANWTGEGVSYETGQTLDGDYICNRHTTTQPTTQTMANSRKKKT